ncbi:citrate (Si)-synthase [Gammaproteobacteria bacterium]|nr:citrate (Si)-synthase [Gammaproteobacteria bacterium]
MSESISQGKAETATIVLPNGKSCQLPVLSSNRGVPVIDIRQLGRNGYYTHDPGFKSTSSCQSDITYIDGVKGKLYYRGHSIESLANQPFESIIHLLLLGSLPSDQQKAGFTKQLKLQADLPAQLLKTFKQLDPNIHPMDKLQIGLHLLKPNSGLKLDTHEQRLQVAFDIIAKMPLLAALCHNPSAPTNLDTYAERFLGSLLGSNAINSVRQSAFDCILMLHADHEQNASTSTVRMVASTGACPYSACAAGIAALSGPKHGGANEACLKMLNTIGSTSNIPDYIDRVKDHQDPALLMGFGHRVYKNYDPRAAVMKSLCHQVMKQASDPLLEIGQQLEAAALEDDYFIQRKLFPNVDYYSGLTLSAMGIPTQLFTVIFALARTTGWLAHWLELHQDPDAVISRPRQRYMGK